MRYYFLTKPNVYQEGALWVAEIGRHTATAETEIDALRLLVVAVNNESEHHREMLDHIFEKELG